MWQVWLKMENRFLVLDPKGVIEKHMKRECAVQANGQIHSEFVDWGNLWFDSQKGECRKFTSPSHSSIL